MRFYATALLLLSSLLLLVATVAGRTLTADADLATTASSYGEDAATNFILGGSEDVRREKLPDEGQVYNTVLLSSASPPSSSSFSDGDEVAARFNYVNDPKSEDQMYFPGIVVASSSSSSSSSFPPSDPLNTVYSIAYADGDLQENVPPSCVITRKQFDEDLVFLPTNEDEEQEEPATSKTTMMMTLGDDEQPQEQAQEEEEEGKRDDQTKVGVLLTKLVEMLTPADEDATMTMMGSGGGERTKKTMATKTMTTTKRGDAMQQEHHMIPSRRGSKGVVGTKETLLQCPVCVCDDSLSSDVEDVATEEEEDDDDAEEEPPTTFLRGKKRGEKKEKGSSGRKKGGGGTKKGKEGAPPKGRGGEAATHHAARPIAPPARKLAKETGARKSTGGKAPRKKLAAITMPSGFD